MSFPVDKTSRIEKVRERGSRTEVARSWGGGHTGTYYLMGTEFLFGAMRKFWKRKGGDQIAP